jgi:hypothetical protein
METKFKIVETEEYTLAVSDGVKAGDKSVLMVEGFTPMILTHFEPVEEGYEGKKIIAYKPKGNAPELDLPLLPYVEDDVEKLAEEYADGTIVPATNVVLPSGNVIVLSNDYIPISFGGKFNETSKRDFIAGYKAATKVYSEDDLKKMFAYAHQVGMNTLLQTQSPHLLEKQDEHKLRDGFIQSLKQPKWFVAEMTVVSDEIDHIYSGNIRYGLKTITINNNTYLVGTYSN